MSQRLTRGVYGLVHDKQTLSGICNYPERLVRNNFSHPICMQNEKEPSSCVRVLHTMELPKITFRQRTHRAAAAAAATNTTSTTLCGHPLALSRDSSSRLLTSHDPNNTSLVKGRIVPSTPALSLPGIKIDTPRRAEILAKNKRRSHASCALLTILFSFGFGRGRQ